MRVSFLESHPVVDGEPQGLFLFGERPSDLAPYPTTEDLRAALAAPKESGGLSAGLPDSGDVVLGRIPEAEPAERALAHIFVGFSEVSHADESELGEWVQTLLPEISPSEFISGALAGTSESRWSLLSGKTADGRSFGHRADVVKTTRPVWIEAPESPLGRRLHLQPLVIVGCGGFVAIAVHKLEIKRVDRRRELERPTPGSGVIMSGPDPDGSPGFLADFLLSLLGDFEQAIRVGNQALNSWETEFFAQIARGNGGEPALRFNELREIQSSSTALEDSLVRLQQEELPAFIGLENFDARGGPARLQGSVSAARGLRDSFRDGLALASSVLTTEQLYLARSAEMRSQRLQGAITRLTAFLLVPAFVGTIFGTTNTWLPGSTPLVRFAWMAGVMVISALATYRLLRKAEGGASE